MAPEADRPASVVDSADKALLLLLLLQEQESVGVAEVAIALGVARSTAHRLLTTLRFRQFALQGPDRRYRRGPALQRLGGRHGSGAGLVELAAPLLDRLRDELDETVHLVVLDGREAVFLYSAESRQPLRIGSRAGARLPAHLTSGGKVLLAALPPGEVQERYAGHLSGRDLTGLRRSLAAVRVAGRGLNEGRTEPGISAVSVGVGAGGEGQPPAAVSVSLPAARLTAARLPVLTRALQRCAANIAAVIG